MSYSYITSVFPKFEYSNVYDANLYNNISTSYKITKSSGYTNLRNLISSVNVYLLPISVWNKHVAPS